MKTLAETKAKILDTSKRDLAMVVTTFAGNGMTVGQFKERIESLLSTALDTAFEEFKGVVKMEKKEILENNGALSVTSHDHYVTAMKSYNQAIDELQSKIKEYEQST